MNHDIAAQIRAAFFRGLRTVRFIGVIDAQREVERAVIGSVVGPVMGIAPRDVPDLALLLFGPMARGTQVGLASD